MKISRILLAASLVTLTSCSVTADLYPVKGPLLSAKPIPVLKAKIHGVLSNSGKITMDLPNGEKGAGKWSVTAPQMSGVVSTSGYGSVSSGMQTAWFTTQGTSYYSGSRPGVNSGQAMVFGDQGTTIEVAFKVGSGTASGFGAAVDNKGNVFRVLF